MTVQELAEIGANVEVLTDRWGIPHIYAANEHDLFVAQGFIAARERLFQMDRWRRKGLGLTGEASCGPDVRRCTEAFVLGVNAFIDLDQLPYEFRELGYRPERWRAEDIVRIQTPGYDSNNWVIGPRRTRSGRPILAHEPHLDMTLPSPRFVTHLAAPGLNVIGAGEPSLPGISVGHNGSVAFAGLDLRAVQLMRAKDPLEFRDHVHAMPTGSDDLIVVANEQNTNRIREVLSGGSGWTVADSLALQVDELNPLARTVVPTLLAAVGKPTDPAERKALELLRAWDFVESADSSAAVVFHTWYRKHLDSRSRRPERTTFANAVAELVAAHGRRPEAWRWGDLHTLTFAHPLPELAGLPPIPRGGSGDTVSYSPFDESFRQVQGASFRIVIDVGAWNESMVVNAPGQSGRPDNKHYDDHLDAWLQGEAFPLSYSRAAVEKVAESRLLLRPVTNERPSLS
ncbi:penicillin acylase family protein [Kibdelosporangium philippinense]|uniref:Penicillin acylase family protein n=1 Tax=Kibdelosporangium philippinense TaxID=211113 RepID=A0ABS8Z6G1_9PSEU|nr:penicillin acylase family protein [Kibdelosporangium philippinense]MCE7003022.1 penicillin acylase family protein [Kibdelosporangium philippinense]